MSTITSTPELDRFWVKPRSPCNNPGSPRCAFLWNVVLEAKGPILDVGCADDPLRFHDRVFHCDIDDWSVLYERRGEKFVQADAHELTKHFSPRSFDTVCLGDVVEHLYDPPRALAECAQVSSRALAFTVWEETRVADGPGKWVVEGQALADEEARKYGAKSNQDMQETLHGGVYRGVDDRETPHLCHIWQFDQDMVDELLTGLVEEQGYRIVYAQRVLEVVHEGIPFFDWLVYMERDDGQEVDAESN